MPLQLTLSLSLWGVGVIMILLLTSLPHSLAVGGTSGRRSSSIRSDLRALVRYTGLEVGGFVDTSTSAGAGEFEQVLLNMFPAVNVVRLKHREEIKLRTSGQEIVAVLGSTDSDKRYVTLDTVLSEAGISACPEFIRITDYGGYELEALKGATSTLKCTKIVCASGNVMRSNESYPFVADVISFMNDHGFAIYNTYENNRIRFFNLVIDVLFVKKEIMDEMYEVGYKAHVEAREK